MKRRRITGFLSPLAAALLALSIPAQQPPESAPRPVVRIERLGDVVGKSVKNNESQDLGEIQDLVFAKDGSITYGVLSFGGFLGMGEKYFAVPWESFSPGPDRTFTLNIDKARLKDAPGFDKSAWPDMANTAWSTSVDRFYSPKAASTNGFGGRSSTLKSATVQSAGGMKLGPVEDLVIDLGRGRAVLVVVAVKHDDAPKTRLVAVPWSAMTVAPMQSLFVLDVEPAVFHAAKAFDAKSWPMLDRTYLTETYRGFGRDLESRFVAGRSSVPVAKILGTDVKNKQGESLGEVQDLVFNKDGRISYAVLSFGGFLGLGEKYFALPWESLVPSTDGTFVLDVDKERLSSAPGFDKTNWPNLADPSWSAEVDRFYAPKIALDRTWGGRADKLRRAAVKTLSGAHFGDVREIMIDVDAGAATMVLVKLVKHEGAKERLTAIPWRSLNAVPTEDKFVLNVAEDAFAAAPGFESNAWPAMDRSYSAHVYRHFGREFDAEYPTAVGASGAGSTTESGPCCRSGEMIGTVCRSSDGAALGVVRDLVFAGDRGRILFLVLDTPADDGRLRAVPWSLCRFGKTDGCTAKTDAATLEKAPAFSESKWPDFDDRTCRDGVCTHFGVAAELMKTDGR